MGDMIQMLHKEKILEKDYIAKKNIHRYFQMIFNFNQLGITQNSVFL